VQICLFCVFFFNFVLLRRLLVERHWVLGSEVSSPLNSCRCFGHSLWRLAFKSLSQSLPLSLRLILLDSLETSWVCERPGLGWDARIHENMKS
jgi:hypothetical protein